MMVSRNPRCRGIRWIINLIVTSFAVMAQEKFTGQVCSGNSECESNTCRSGACMASPDCYPIKHEYGKPFDRNAAIMVIVDSGFLGFTHETWSVQANATYWNLFSQGILYKINESNGLLDNLSAFYVSPKDLSKSYCDYNCGGPEGWLCCDREKAQELATRCFPVGDSLETVIIHNDNRYGHAGYHSVNVAALTTNPESETKISNGGYYGFSWMEILSDPTKAPPLLSSFPPTTAPPTLAPTLRPTLSPTTQQTTMHTNLPTRSPTPLPTTMQLPSTPETTAPPTSTPTIAPTIEPTRISTRLPTTSPTLTPTVVPGTRLTGQVCSQNMECKSSACRNGVCMASSDCYPVKHRYGSPFDKNKINIVFVASSFTNASHKKWQAQVNTTYGVFENYNMFAKDVEELNAFRVDPVQLDSSFCTIGCQGIDRMLCCDVVKAHSLSSKCFPVGSTLQTVVIHNSKKYGGAGYTYANMATVTTHQLAPLVAIHELGHSLFELADEYWYGPGTDLEPNCAASTNCDKWSDLVGNTPNGYDTVQCIPGCSNNNYYVASNSFMNDLSRPVGAVNERFSCCTYQVLTKSTPSYCGVFNVAPNYLFDYCQKNDYQQFGAFNYELEPLLAIRSNGTAAVPDERAKYVYVSDPVLVTISSRTRRKTGKTVIKSQRSLLTQGLFLRSQVEGDFRKMKAAAKLGVDSLLRVVVSYRSGKEVMLFSQNTTMEVPLPEPNSVSSGASEPRVLFEKSNAIEVVLDTKGRRIKSIRTKIVKTR